MQIAVFEGLVDDLLASQVKSVTIQTAYGPDLVLDRPFEPTPPGAGDAITRAMKPRIEIQLGGSNPITWAPYGDPRPTKWPWVEAALAGGVILGVLALAAKISRPRRR